MSKDQTQVNPTLTRFELTKRILVLLGLASFTALCLMVTKTDPGTGWFGTALFGLMTLLVGVDLFKLRNHKLVRGDGARKNAGAALVWTGTMIVSIVFGVVGTLLAEVAAFRRPAIAIWLATFVSTLAFYPFRGEQAKDLPTFPIWAIYCALMGFVSVAISFLERLLR